MYRRQHRQAHSQGDTPAHNKIQVKPMNSFAMIFGHCVWIPPSPMAAMLALNLFFGIGIHTDSEYTAASSAIVQQYVSTGKTEAAAKKAVADLDACFGTYEVLPENTNHPETMAEPRTVQHRTAKTAPPQR
jgi:hypothetical protein